MGGTLGVLAGLPLASAMLLVMGGQDVAFAVSPTAVLLGYAVAITVTVLAASGAARRAAAVPPMAALRMDAVVPREVLRTRTLVGLGLVAVAVAGVGATADPSAENLPRIIGLISAVLAVVGVLVLAPRLAAAGRWCSAR